MRTYRLALIGFGNVGQGLATILRDHGEALAARHKARFPIVAVVTARRGSLYDPNGLDPAALLAAAEAGGSLESLPAAHHGWDALTTVVESNADVVVEVTPTDTATGDPAATTIRAALRDGRHVVTANKGPIALHYPELAGLAAANGVALGVEATVMGGTPVMRLGSRLLGDAGVRSAQGILNGTTNFILTKMETEGMEYGEALTLAQKLGYAEADPTADVEGYDALAKIVILANVLLGASLKTQDVARQGITSITRDDVVRARQEGFRFKLIAQAKKEGGAVKASVAPRKLPLSDPLAGVMGAQNALSLVTDLMGKVTIQGAGAGKTETGFSILSDMLAIHRRLKKTRTQVL
jgi:homoserine dehydrogenase